MGFGSVLTSVARTVPGYMYSIKQILTSKSIVNILRKGPSFALLVTRVKMPRVQFRKSHFFGLLAC